ncbi:MAG: hypothetical protein ACR2NZ_11310 [Rubripirellula sp.]
MKTTEPAFWHRVLLAILIRCQQGMVDGLGSTLQLGYVSLAVLALGGNVGLRFDSWRRRFESFDIVWPAASSSVFSDLGVGVPNMGFDDDGVVTVSSEVEHQTLNLKSRVRLPYRVGRSLETDCLGRCETSTMKLEEEGRLKDPLAR